MGESPLLQAVNSLLIEIFKPSAHYLCRHMMPIKSRRPLSGESAMSRIRPALQSSQISNSGALHVKRRLDARG